MKQALVKVAFFIQRLPVTLLVFLCRFWQVLLSPFVGDRCRFYPTCSHYAVQSLQEHGLVRGGWLTIHRVCRCNPRCAGGIDPVPQKAR